MPYYAQAAVGFGGADVRVPRICLRFHKARIIFKLRYIVLLRYVMHKLRLITVHRLITVVLTLSACIRWTAILNALKLAMVRSDVFSTLTMPTLHQPNRLCLLMNLGT